MARVTPSMLVPFLALYAALYAAFGAQSPYLPALLESRGIGAEPLSFILAGSTAIRIIIGPLAGRLADRFDAPRLALALGASVAAAAALAFWRAPPFWPLLAVALAQAAALAPLVPLSDRLALAGALPRGAGPGDRPFDYGWVRGAGSLAFIGGSVLAGQAVDRLGLPVVLALSAPLLLAGAFAALRVPRLQRRSAPNTAVASVGARGGVGALLQVAAFRRLVLVAALVLGSHAFHDSFAVIRWRAAGMTTGTAGLLWSESVAAEVLIFVALGRPLLERVGAARAAALAAIAGVVRWSVMAVTASVPAMAVVEPLHGLTFALLHLACMQILAAIVPPPLAATALALYGTVAIGAATAALTLAAGPLYVWIGAGGFWVMAGLGALALPLARGLGTDAAAPVTSSARGRER